MACAYSKFPIYWSCGPLSDLETPALRTLVWLGNSKRNIRGFPEGAQKLIGDELQLIQFGGMPKDAAIRGS
jgi:hypothetical protein